MTHLFYAAAVVELGLLLAGVALLLGRRHRVDLIMVTQLLATLCVGLLITLGEALGRRELDDVALVLALLAVITTLAFVRMGWRPGEARR